MPLKFGDPSEIRTPDTLIKRQVSLFLKKRNIFCELNSNNLVERNPRTYSFSTLYHIIGFLSIIYFREKFANTF